MPQDRARAGRVDGAPDIAGSQVWVPEMVNANMSVKLSCVVGTWNEAGRIGRFMEHAVKWADEILVVDKSSTDGTQAMAEAAGARVISVPFSPAGGELAAEHLRQARNEWLFVMTPGEVPTRLLIRRLMELLEARGNDLDLVVVPKKLWSLGVHNRTSPWSVSYQPFVVHRTRAKISGQIHRNFSAAPERCGFIEFSEHCHLKHPTHATAKGFLKSHFDYIMAEASGPDSGAELMSRGLKASAIFDFNGDPELLGQALAWKVYWLGVALAGWEKKRGRDVPEEYRALTEEALQEWRMTNDE